MVVHAHVRAPLLFFVAVATRWENRPATRRRTDAMSKKNKLATRQKKHNFRIKSTYELDIDVTYSPI